MRTSKKLTLLTLAVSMTALIGAVASPSVADDPRSGPLVLTKLAPEVTLEQLQEQAGEIRGERLPVQGMQVTVVDAERELTAPQLAAVVTGKETEGARWRGEVLDPSPDMSLEAVARAIRFDDVVLWECYVIYVIIGGWVYEILVCRPLVLRA